MKRIDKFVYNTMLLSINLFLIEIIFKLISHNNLFDSSMIRILLSTIIISLIVSYINLYLKSKNSKRVNIIISFIFSIYALFQAGFHNFIGVYISLNISSQAGAVTGYILDFFKSFYWYYYLIILPPILLIIYYKYLEKNIKKIFKFKLKNIPSPTINTFKLISFILVLGFSYHLTLTTNIFQNKLQTISNYSLFQSPNNASLAIKQFGSTMYFFLDFKNLFISSEEIITNTENESYKQINNLNDTKWLSLIENEEDYTLNTLNKYFISNEIHEENSYTGLFENKNLIVIMMESVNDIFINEELYPNFYRLVSSGYYFKNHYSPRNSCATGNNELSGMIGLYSIYNKCTANVYSNNLYPESIFNLFNYKGYKTTSMHDYTEKYYQRREIHKNMGSMQFFDVDDLKISHDTKEEEWASDEEFMKKVVKKLSQYKKDERFMTWLTTVTSHQPYGSSLYGDKYLYLFEDSKYDNYDIKLKRYMSKLKVLDDGLGVLLKGLESQNRLDDTVIILYGDHYPYGLSNSILKEALPYSIDEKYENERVPFVIWSNDIEGTVINKHSSYVNLTPTVANLFNLDYDSRYYVGNDLFANNYQGITIFADSSWKNNIAYYDAATSEITYYTDKTYTIEELIAINDSVEKKIKYSNLAIQHDYFNYLYKNLNVDYKSKLQF